MATTSLTLTNNSGSEQFYGGTRVANSDSFSIEDGDRQSLLEDNTFLVDLAGGDAVIDNGVFDLSEAVALKALRAEQATITSFWHGNGLVTIGSFLKEMLLPPGIGEYKVPYTGYISRSVTSNLLTGAFTVDILVNSVVQDTISYPAAGSTQESFVDTHDIPVVLGDDISIKLASGDPEDPSVKLILQDW
jgi:hypothetical protein